MFDLVIGLGQGGNRIAKSFSNTFRIEGRYLNTADVDFSKFDAPRGHSLIIDGDGTGRDPRVGERMIKENLDGVYEFFDNAISSNKANNILVCVGGGGGSGTGMMLPTLEHLVREEKKNVLVLYTVPCKSEGIPAKPQSLAYLNKVIHEYVGDDKKKSDQVGLLLIDNDYCLEKYRPTEDTREGRLSMSDYWASVNSGIARAFGHYYNLTMLDQYNYIDSSTGIGSLDFNELIRILYFKEGFVDLRSFSFQDQTIYRDELTEKIRHSSLVFSSLDIKTTKAYIISISLPVSWRGSRKTGNFVDTIFEEIGRYTKTPYVLRSSFYSGQASKATVRLLLSGMSRAKGLEKMLKGTVKDTIKFKKKGNINELDLSELADYENY